MTTKWHLGRFATSASHARTINLILKSQSYLAAEIRYKAKQAGFFIRLFYVCTTDPAINVGRITQHYLNGGHEVPISKVISRYYKSLQNAAKAIAIVDRAYIYDNSIDGQLPRLRLQRDRF